MGAGQILLHICEKSFMYVKIGLLFMLLHVSFLIIILLVFENISLRILFYFSYNPFKQLFRGRKKTKILLGMTNRAARHRCMLWFVALLLLVIIILVIYFAVKKGNTTIVPASGASDDSNPPDGSDDGSG